jgi:hypothetical protein
MSQKKKMPLERIIQLILKMNKMMMNSTDMKKLETSDILTEALWI